MRISRGDAFGTEFCGDNRAIVKRINVLYKPSGIDPFVHKVTRHYKPIKETKLIKTKARLNKWDMKKISHLK